MLSCVGTSSAIGVDFNCCKKAWLAQVHELKKEADAEKLVRAALDAAAMNPAEKTIHVFVACGGDSTVNAGVTPIMDGNQLHARLA